MGIVVHHTRIERETTKVRHGIVELRLLMMSVLSNLEPIVGLIICGTIIDNGFSRNAVVITVRIGYWRLGGEDSLESITAVGITEIFSESCW